MAKFSVGDTVTIEATVVKKDLSCCGPDYKVSVKRHPGIGNAALEQVSESSLTLVKKAIPPRPAAGTIISYEPLADCGVYVVQADGNTLRFLEFDSYAGKFRNDPGMYTWETLPHDKAKVI